MLCPHAQSTVDHFHVVQRVPAAVRAVRRRVRGPQRGVAPWRASGLVLRNREALTTDERVALGPVLAAYPALRQAYLLKVDLHRWYRQATAATAQLELWAWDRAVAASAIAEVVALGGIFRSSFGDCQLVSDVWSASSASAVVSTFVSPRPCPGTYSV